MSCAPVAAARSTKSAAKRECVNPVGRERLGLGAFASLTPIQAAPRMSQNTLREVAPSARRNRRRVPVLGVFRRQRSGGVQGETDTWANSSAASSTTRPATTAGRKCEVDVLQHGAFGGQDDVLVQNLPAECPR